MHPGRPFRTGDLFRASRWRRLTATAKLTSAKGDSSDCSPISDNYSRAETEWKNATSCGHHFTRGLGLGADSILPRPTGCSLWPSWQFIDLIAPDVKSPSPIWTFRWGPSPTPPWGHAGAAREDVFLPFCSR
jgi:hypothetical protein